MPNKQLNLGMALGLLASTGVIVPERKPKRHVPMLKQCINCGKGHNHNNSFCSADCCKKYKESK